MAGSKVTNPKTLSHTSRVRVYAMDVALPEAARTQGTISVEDVARRLARWMIATRNRPRSWVDDLLMEAKERGSLLEVRVRERLTGVPDRPDAPTGWTEYVAQVSAEGSPTVFYTAPVAGEETRSGRAEIEAERMIRSCAGEECGVSWLSRQVARELGEDPEGVFRLLRRKPDRIPESLRLYVSGTDGAGRASAFLSLW